jgi:hypothetical protein
MNIRRWIFALAALLIVAPAHAQESLLQARLDAQTYKGVSEVIASTSSLGIPTQSLVSKALEGASKGASGERIVAAVRKLAGQLVLARGSLGAASTAAELDAGATALHIGVSPAELERLRAARPRQSLTVPLGMLADLVARGVPTDSAGAVVLALARTNMRDEDFVAFRRNVERDIALGAPPSAAASVRVNATTRAFAEGASNSQSAQTPRKP